MRVTPLGTSGKGYSLCYAGCGPSPRAGSRGGRRGGPDPLPPELAQTVGDR